MSWAPAEEEEEQQTEEEAADEGPDDNTSNGTARESATVVLGETGLGGLRVCRGRRSDVLCNDCAADSLNLCKGSRLQRSTRASRAGSRCR